jgi:hypothetical protein
VIAFNFYRHWNWPSWVPVKYGPVIGGAPASMLHLGPLTVFFLDVKDIRQDVPKRGETTAWDVEKRRLVKWSIEPT